MDKNALDAFNKYFPGPSNYSARTISDLFDLADLVDDIESNIRDLAEDSGMPAHHFFLLEHLTLNGGSAALGDLLVVLNLPKQSATYVVNRLELDGLVVRQKDPKDKRRFEVTLTASGRQFMKKHIGPFYRTMLEAVQEVSKADRVVMLRGLGIFRDMLRTSRNMVMSRTKD